MNKTKTLKKYGKQLFKSNYFFYFSKTLEFKYNHTIWMFMLINAKANFKKSFAIYISNGLWRNAETSKPYLFAKEKNTLYLLNVAIKIKK